MIKILGLDIEQLALTHMFYGCQGSPSAQGTSQSWRMLLNRQCVPWVRGLHWHQQNKLVGPNPLYQVYNKWHTTLRYSSVSVPRNLENLNTTSFPFFSEFPFINEQNGKCQMCNISINLETIKKDFFFRFFQEKPEIYTVLAFSSNLNLFCCFNIRCNIYILIVVLMGIFIEFRYKRFGFLKPKLQIHPIVKCESYRLSEHIPLIPKGWRFVHAQLSKGTKQGQQWSVHG